MAAPPPYRIVFVCLGNICRSPMAEIVLRSLLRRDGLVDEVEVSSAGTGDYHIGERIDERAADVLESRGYDSSRHRARQFSVDEFEHADLVVALDRENFTLLRELAPTPDAAGRIRLLRSFDPATARAAVGSARASDADLEVPDPYFGGPDGFEHALDLVESACRGLLAAVRDRLHPPR
jgi:protein-tyrosine phosphatase